MWRFLSTENSPHLFPFQPDINAFWKAPAALFLFSLTNPHCLPFANQSSFSHYISQHCFWYSLHNLCGANGFIIASCDAWLVFFGLAVIVALSLPLCKLQEFLTVFGKCLILAEAPSPLETFAIQPILYHRGILKKTRISFWYFSPLESGIMQPCHA